MMTLPNKNVEQSFALAKERYAAFGVNVDRALEQSQRFRSRCTAGRVTMSAVSRTPAKRLAAGWRSREIIRARPAHPTSCAPIWTRRWR